MTILSGELEREIENRAAMSGRTPDQLVRAALASLDAARQALPSQRLLPKHELLSRLRDISRKSAADPVLDPCEPE